MAFISDKDRTSLIKKINRSYAFKKFLLLVEILALICFIIVSFVSWMNVANGNAGWSWFTPEKTLTTLGIGMAVYAAIIGVLGIVSVILIFTIKSPKGVIKQNKTLEASALSGKKIKNSETAGDVMRARTTIKKKK